MISQSRRRLIGRLRSRRMRGREGVFLVEGVRAAEEALDAGMGVRFAVVTDALDGSERGGLLLRRLRGSGHETVVVEAQELDDLADTEAPQGVLLVCDEPLAQLDALTEPSDNHVFQSLVLDGVQDPGNAGTLIRAAAAFALDVVIVLNGTVDPWNPKVVRAGAGSSFRIPVVRTKWSAYHEWLRARGVALLVADAAGADVRTLERGHPSGWSLVVGNEGAGPRAEVLEHATARVAVPMPGGIESLNAGVAGAILLYDLTGRSRID